MTQPRETLISIADTPDYHHISRCIRRTLFRVEVSSLKTHFKQNQLE